MKTCLYVGLGGFLGSVARYLLSLAFASFSGAFPFGTLLINFMGSFLIGGINEFVVKTATTGSPLPLFLMVGVCGGFTTFSTFSAETVDLLEKSKILLGVGYAAVSVTACLLGVGLGKLLVKQFV